MSQKVTATRAVLAKLSADVIRFITIISITIFTVLLIGTAALAYYISAWWALLLIIVLPLLFIFLVLRLIAGFILKKLQPKNLTTKQSSATKKYAEKLKRLAETRGMGWPMFAFLSFKDLLLYRDLRTARNTLDDTTSLKSDFSELERLF